MSSINKIRANNEVYDIEDLAAQTLAAELQQKISGLETDISNLEKADSSTEKNVDSLSEDVTEILKLIDALNTSVSGMQYRFDTVTDTLETLQDNDIEFTQDIASLTSQLSDMKKSVSSLSETVNTLNKDFTSLSSTTDSLKSTVDNLRSEINDIWTMVYKLEDQIGLSQVRIVTKSITINALNSNYSVTGNSTCNSISGYFPVGIVGIQNVPAGVVPFIFYIDDGVLYYGFYNAGTSASVSASVTFYCIYILNE